MNAIATPTTIDALESRIAPLRSRLTSHPLYASIRTPQHLRFFMQSHVFAVWDFMSILKALQSALTCVTVPWLPSAFPESRRFINEIVLGEESDQFEGRAISHFELYLEAMHEAGADTSPIRNLLASLTTQPGSLSVNDVALNIPAIPIAARAFMSSTFHVIRSGNLAAMAAAFTFGREDVIPDMFRHLVRDLNTQHSGAFAKYIWYLERHIEVDGEDHGPLSLRMVADLCGSNEALWETAATAAESAIAARIALWDGILSQLN
ncbi:DUF3050 domain-containing protein [Granulicella sp. 5B5]|uniref:DUF3050 domain-containing protein n=1 Tax=Granulicella sp. 5B5 TaxID=1617967 RepID=UPI001772C8FF|nr:DUF3050 domain-containing protein [Granulicella sp. 5B5]QMV18152.1 DUF3050 domain-containing protein [Granulicella sp. 5B5]